MECSECGGRMEKSETSADTDLWLDGDPDPATVYYCPNCKRLEAESGSEEEEGADDAPESDGQGT